MATVADIIRRSFSILGVVASGESIGAADQADALETLNDMLDSWATERLTLFATLRSELTLTAGLSPHTIGAAGTFNTTRPVRVDRASLLRSGSETPLAILSDAQWQTTQGKDTEGTPSAVWVESSYPLVKLYLNPIPSIADTLVLYTWQQLGRFADANATFDLPPGYPRAIRYNLAKELAPDFGVSLSGEALDIANDSLAKLKRLNHKPRLLTPDATGTGRGGGSADMGSSPSTTNIVGGLF